MKSTTKNWETFQFGKRFLFINMYVVGFINSDKNLNRNKILKFRFEHYVSMVLWCTGSYLDVETMLV